MAQALRAGLRNGGIRRGGLRPGLGNGSLFAVAPLDLFFARNRTLDPRVTFTRASSGTYTDSQGVLRTAATNEPRFDHNPTTGESLGLLVEEQRTNLLLNSGTLSTQNVTVTAAAHTLSFTGTGTITLSGTSTAGPLIGTGTGEANRVSLTFTPTAGTLTLTVSGTVTNAQLEASSFRTSYIPTAGAAATRSADVVSISGSSFSSWFTSSGGTCFAEFRASLTTSASTLYSFNDTTASNRITGLASSTAFLAGRNTNGAGVTFTPFTGNTPTAAASNKAAIAFADLDVAIVGNGGTPGTASNYNVPTVTRLELGQQLAGTYLNGTIRRLTYWPQRLSNPSLQAITR